MWRYQQVMIKKIQYFRVEMLLKYMTVFQEEFVKDKRK